MMQWNISHLMIAENNKMAIQRQSHKETANREKNFYHFENRPMVSALCTPVQVSMLPKSAKSQGLPDGTARENILPVCRSPYYWWTGAESILQSP